MFNYPGQSFSIIPSDSLALWLDANSEILDNGYMMPSWKDKTGLMSVSQQYPACRPTFYKSVINGCHAIRFDGDSAFFTCQQPFLTNLENSVVFSVAMRTGNETARNFIIETINGLTASHEVNQLSNPSAWIDNGSGGATQASVSNSVVSNIPVLLRSSYKASTGAFNFSYNRIYSKAITRTPGMIATNSGFNIGTYRNADGRFFEGYICEIIAYSRALTTQEINQIENYLCKKWGIPL